MEAANRYIEGIFNFDSVTGSVLEELFGASSVEELTVLGSIRPSAGIGVATADEVLSDELQQPSRVDGGAPLVDVLDPGNGAEGRHKGGVVKGRHVQGESAARRPSGGGSEKGSSQKATLKRPRGQIESPLQEPSIGSETSKQNNEERSKKRQGALAAVDKWNGLLKADDYLLQQQYARHKGVPKLPTSKHPASRASGP